MSFQFIHIQCTARSKPKKNRTGSDAKWTANDIAGEAMRNPLHSPHVKSPLPPVVVHGLDAYAVVAVATARAESSLDPMGRKIRLDTPIMLAGVASNPIPVADLSDPDKEDEYEFWKQETVAFLNKKYGENLLSVIEHKDEKFPHVHFYVVPPVGVGFNAKKLHAGFAAGARAGKNMPLQKQLYSDAMRAFQDSYHLEVAVKCGQARLGPRRARLTRAEWLTQKVTLSKAAKVFQTLNKRIKNTIVAARTKANSIVGEARIQAQSRGLKLGSWFDGMRGNASELVEKYRDAARTAEAKRKEAEAAKVEAERAKKFAVDSKAEAVQKAVADATRPLRVRVEEEWAANEKLNQENRLLTEKLRRRSGLLPTSLI